jgi:hypothetical protein
MRRGNCRLASSLRRLDGWRLPKGAGRVAPFAPALRWAAAAAVVLACGLALGRWSVPARPADLRPLRAEMESSLRASLASEFQTALGRLETNSWQALAATEARLAEVSQAEIHQLRQDVAVVLESARQEDRQAVRTLLQELEQRHDAALVALRKDLETVATLTEQEIRQARQRFFQLAGYNPLSTDN